MKDTRQKSSYTPLQRGLAMAGILLIAAVVLLLIYNLLTGGPESTILGLLFCLIVLPCILYGFRMYVEHTVKKKEKE